MSNKIKRRMTKRQKAIRNIRDGIAILARQQFGVTLDEDGVQAVLNHIATLTAQNPDVSIDANLVRQAILNKIEADKA